MNRESHNLKLLEITIERLIKVYELTEIPEFNNDIQREIQKAAMKTGEQVLFDYVNENNTELISLNYKLSHIIAAKNIIKDLEKDVERKRESLIKKMNSRDKED